MKKFTLFTILFLIAGLVSWPGSAPGAEKDDIVRKLQEKYDRISTFSASFIQTTRGGVGEISSATGRAYFKKPGKMRWVYSLPVKDEIISNGFRVWVYQPDLGQAIETMVDRSATSIERNFLSGIGNIKRDFVVVSAVKRGNHYRLELIPRFLRSDVERVILEVSTKDYLVRRFTIIGRTRTRTEVLFSSIEIDRPISDSFFNFYPPPGVSIIVR